MAKRLRDAPPAKQGPDTIQVLPMQLRIGDRFTDETGAWEIVERPTTERGGKGVRAKAQSPGQPQTRRERLQTAEPGLRGRATLEPVTHSELEAALVRLRSVQPLPLA